MRKFSLKPVISDSGAVEVKPANTAYIAFEEHIQLENALKKLTFLKSYSSRLTIRLAAWDAVEEAFDGERVRLVPDEKHPAEKYADIHFSIEAKDE